jgi:hypothetical protein
VTTSIFLNGADVYVVGSYRNSNGYGMAAYWKNGVLDTLPQYPGTFETTATGLVVAGSDVYVVGYGSMIGINGVWGLYWKNGVEGTLTKAGSIYSRYGVAVGK